MQRFIVQTKAMHKRHVFLLKNRDALHYEKYQIENDNIAIEKDVTGVQGSNLNMYKPYEFVPLEMPIKFLATLQAYFDSESAFLGMSGKGILHKQSGATDGEVQQNLAFITAIQNRLYMSLRSVCIRLREKFGIDISVVNKGDANVFNLGMPMQQPDISGMGDDADVTTNPKKATTY